MELLVVAAGSRGCAGVDLASGALLRGVFAQPCSEPLEVYDVISAEPVKDDQVAFTADTVLLAAPERIGRLGGPKVVKLLRPLVHPKNQHLLGVAASSVPYWTVPADRPSLALVNPTAGPVVERTSSYRLECRFRWRRLDYILPLDDPNVEEALSHPSVRRVGGRTLNRALGWKPRWLLVGLTPPRAGHCHKVVAALLPRP